LNNAFVAILFCHSLQKVVMYYKKLLPCALLLLTHGAFAQQAPNAAGQMQQIPRVPEPLKGVPPVDRQQSIPSTVGSPERIKVFVSALLVTGAQAFPEALLLDITGFKPGSELSLSDLRAMAERIAEHYRRNGYFIAQAYLPAQDIQNGIVTIAVIEGQYGKVVLNNQSRVSSDLANSLLGGLNSGDPVIVEPLERRLLLLSDLPGVRVKSTLMPGALVGTSDLMVDLIPGQRVSGSVDADNAGSRYTGENRVGTTLNFNELIGQGDVATLRALTSGTGLNYVRGSYQMQFGRAKAGVAYSSLRYELGQEFASLGAHGSAEVASLFASFPLIRARNANLYAGVNLDDKTFQDTVDVTSSMTDKKAQNLTASIYGDIRDSLGGGGLTSYSLAWSTGNIDIKTPAVQAADAATALSGGHFNKLGFSVARTQRVTDSVSISAAINGQFASKNLDVSEKMELGGMYGVRAYPEGEAYADQGYVLNLEARYQLPNFADSQTRQVQLIGFIDAGRVDTNRNPWSAGPNRRTLSGAGVGLNWSDTNNFMVRAYYAVKLGDEAATSAPDRTGRFWVQAVKYF
jgi:hemolysin activation/secretion protein